MKILITGGTGLLGSNLIKILEKDHQVFAPTREMIGEISHDGFNLLFLNSNHISNLKMVSNIEAFKNINITYEKGILYY